MRHQGGTCGPALLRNLLICLFLQSNMSSLPYYYIIIGGIQWFKVLGGSFLPEITSSTKHSSLLFPFILFKPFMPLISRACEALYIVVMPISPIHVCKKSITLRHAHHGYPYSPLQRYELFMKLPTFSCYFFIIYIHFFFESFVFFRKSDYLCHRKQIIQLSQVEGIKGIKGEKGA